VREVGIELYQSMLEEAVASLRAGDGESEIADAWSPQINLGAAVLIPEGYVPDLNARMALYRRLSELKDSREIDGFAAELIDRFGPLPEEAGHLLKIVAIKHLCRAAQVEKIEAGPKGATLSFRNNTFPNAAGLVKLITEHRGTMHVRPDQKLVVMRDWPSPEARLKGAELLVGQLAKLAASTAAPPPSTNAKQAGKSVRGRFSA
jgi:transcription-repair coupling factor (superfamily II helicase)